MSGQSKLFSDSCITAADLSSYQYRFVKLTAGRTVNICGAGDKIYGILQNNPKSGELAEVMTYGISNLKLGDTVTVDVRIKAGTLGVGVPVAADREEFGAEAREGGVIGDIISVNIIKGQTSQA